MQEIQDLERAIAALESQRSLLGESTVEIALAPLRDRLRALKARPAPADLQLKYVSVLFADVVNSTQLGQHLDPEEVLDVMNTALTRFDQVISQHGGRVTNFMGDGLRAIFGIPSALEDDAERAVRAGLKMVEAAQEYARKVEETWQISGFNIRVGINTGQIAVGSGVEEENTAMGMAVNLAARMESAAPVGGVLISENTYQHVHGAFELIPQPVMHVKGFDQAVQTYQVVRARPRPFHPSGRGIRGIRTAMVGREMELAHLKDALRAITERPHAQLITILGEAGVGKTRLLEEFETWINGQAIELNCYKGRASPQFLLSPFSLLRDLFAAAFSILESDPAEQARMKLENGLVRQLGEEAQMKAHFIGALLGYDFHQSPHLSGALNQPKQINQRGLYYLDQYFVNATQAAPCLILLEDIHWGDTPSLEFIQQMTGRLGDHPLLVICLARRLLLENHPEYILQGEEGAAETSRLELNPLAEDQSRSLVQAILAHLQPLPSSLEDLIVGQAEGNPFYIEELINVLIDDGTIRMGERETGWQIDLSRLENLRIPPSLTAVLQARLDGLPPAEKYLLQRAAVIGRTFWDQPLQNLMESTSPPTYVLASLCGRGLIHPNLNSTFQEAGEYAFRHSLLREVTYETVLKRDRQRFHANIANWLSQITQTSGRTEEHLSLIAEHFEKGGDADQAAGWYLRAGERAKVQGAPRQALHFYNRALELLPETQKQQRWRALLGRNEVLGVLGETEARDRDDQALLDMAHTADDPAWRSEAYARLGWSATNKGDERTALEAYEASLAAARVVGDIGKEANILSLATSSLTRLGDLGRAREYTSLALERAREAGDDTTLARVINNVTSYYSDIGDLSKSIELLEQQIVLTHRLGEQHGEAIGNMNIGYDYVQMGMYTTAQKHLEDAQRLCDLIGARHTCLYGQLNLGLAFCRSGDLPEALQVLTAAAQALSSMGDHFGFAAALTYQALVYEATGDFTQAMQVFEQAHGSYTKIGMPALAMDAKAGCVRCGIGAEKPEVTCQNAEEIWTHLEKERGNGMEFPILAFLTCIDAFTVCGNIERARSVLNMGYQELMDRASKISDTSWRQTYLEKVPEHATLLARYQAAVTGNHPVP